MYFLSIMKVFGLTGGIATGKSAVAEMFLELGASIIDADLLAREVVKPGREAYEKILERFGEEILNEDGTINREALGRVVFNDRSALRKLNSLTHPRVFELMARGVEDARSGGAKVTIVDIPLLYESGAEGWVEKVILVYADRGAQLKRLMERDKCGERRALARINSQTPIDEKRAKAEFVIDNSGDLENTRRQTVEVWAQITGGK